MESTVTYRRGYSIFEVLIVVGILGVVAAIAVRALVAPKEAAEFTKLQTEVRAVNAAVSIYEAFGGSMVTVTTAEEVIDQLKTKADAVSAERVAGLTGSFIDPRVVVDMQTSDEALTDQARATWVPVRRQFVIIRAGAPGVKRFLIDDSIAAAPAIVEARGRMLDLATVDKWIWEYTDTAATGLAAPTMITTLPTGGGPPGPPPPGPPVPGPLAAPIFSIVTGTFPITAFNMSLTLTDPNPSGTGQVVYSVNSGPWINYTGTPITVMPGAEVKAYTVAIDVAWTDSSESLQQYYAGNAQLAIPVISSSAAQFDFTVNQDILVTITNPNDPGISMIEYRLNQEAWQPYAGPFNVNVLNYSGGLEVESRAVSTSPYWVDSELASHMIDGPIGVQLDPPVISFSDDRFESGVSSITVTLANPNPGGSSTIQYQIIPVGGGFTTGFLFYGAPFAVTDASYPDGFAIKAYAKSSTSPYTDSDFAMKSTGSFFGNDVDTGGLKGTFYDLKQFADGSPTNIDADTASWYNRTYYDYVREITPYIGGSTYGFNPAVLDQFYRDEKELYATRIVSPDMPATEAPAAFGVAVSPTNWIVHYTGEIEALEAGMYRFSGRSDDVIQVWIDGQLVMSGAAYAWEMSPNFNWTSGVNWTSYLATSGETGPYPTSSAAMREDPVGGPWISMDGRHRMDVIIGEQPGASFNMHLRVEKQGVTYTDGPQVFTLLPLTAEDETEVSGTYWRGIPGTSNPPLFRMYR